MAEHVPVMVASVLGALAPKPGARIVDATLGAGGHAEAILRALGPQGVLLGLDRDPEMLARAEARLQAFRGSLRLSHARFSRLAEVVREGGLEQVDGVLFDFGICSAQLDDPARGLSFAASAEGAPLDMRLDRGAGAPASELLAATDEAELAEILRAGDVPMPRRVARALCAAAPLETTGDLLHALEGVALPRRRHHPATLVFQALRMAVNDEIGELERGLAQAVDVLAPGGRLVTLSYHSGEDARVKRLLAAEERGCICPPRLPACACGRRPRLHVLVRGEGPSDDEVARNPRARSARLRGAERW
jgi:16S rRNA (cytosine1402-N4)-methyltransferase